MKRTFVGGALLILAWTVWPVDAAAQCAMCKATLETSIEGPRLAVGMNRGILVMLAAPYAVFGTFIATLFRVQILGWLARASAGVRARVARHVFRSDD